MSDASLWYVITQCTGNKNNLETHFYHVVTSYHYYLPEFLSRTGSHGQHPCFRFTTVR